MNLTASAVWFATGNRYITMREGWFGFWFTSILFSLLLAVGAWELRRALARLSRWTALQPAVVALGVAASGVAGAAMSLAAVHTWWAPNLDSQVPPWKTVAALSGLAPAAPAGGAVLGIVLFTLLLSRVAPCGASTSKDERAPPPST